MCKNKRKQKFKKNPIITYTLLLSDIYSNTFRFIFFSRPPRTYTRIRTIRYHGNDIKITIKDLRNGLLVYASYPTFNI